MLVKNIYPGQHNLYITCKWRIIFYNHHIMATEIKEFSLLRFIPQFREFNSATKQNRERLAPYFWWASTNGTGRFNFILISTMLSKLAKIKPDLPCNKKFIICTNGKFAGIAGLDRIYVGAPRPELWLFLTKEFEGKGIATDAIKWATNYALKQSCHKICATTKCDNMRIRRPLLNNDFEVYDSNYYNGDHTLWWEKTLNNKSY